MMSPKEKILLEAGREMAVGLLEKAVTEANSPEQQTNQIILLQFAAIHILATVLFDIERDQGTKMGEAFYNSVCISVGAELLHLRDAFKRGELQLVQAPADETDKPNLELLH